MSGPILFVINPIAGDSNKELLLNRIHDWVGQRKGETRLWSTTGQNDRANLKDLLKALNPETVVAVGGDGTLKLCAGLLKDSKINLGLIPAGSANGMATELGIPKDVAQALDIIEKQQIKRIDLLQFGKGEIGLHISDIGLNAAVVQKFETSDFRGFLGYTTSLIQQLQDLNPFAVKIITNGQEFQYDTIMVAIANAKRYGTGALLNAQGEIDDGYFELCILKEFDLINIGKQFFDYIGEDSPHMEVIQCREAKIEILNGSSVPFQVDGESKEKVDKVHIQILPQCLNMIVPE